MDIKDYSEKEIEHVLKSFSAYIKLVVNHAAIDYARKLKSQRYNVISLNECVEKEMSLSMYDNGIFLFSEIDDSDIIFSNSKYNRAFKKLTKKEQRILKLYSKNYTPYEISKVLKITQTNVTTIKSRAIIKFKKYISEVDRNED